MSTDEQRWQTADAEVWQTADGWWHGHHDGECAFRREHEGPPFELPEVLKSISRCLGGWVRWEVVVYPDSEPGLQGFRETERPERSGG